MGLQLLEVLDRKRSDAEQLHQIAGRNPVAFFMHIIVQKILGFLFGLALHDIAETPDLDVASVFFFGQAPILLDFRSGEIEIVRVELDERYVGIFRGKVPALLGTPAFMIAG
jgi:hypothetical protein